jgi:hypothetical protein
LPASLALVSLGLPTEVPLPLPVVPELLPLDPDEDPVPDPDEPDVPPPMLLSAPPVLPELPASMPLELPPYWLVALGLEAPLPPYWLVELGLEAPDELLLPVCAIAAPVASPSAAATIANFLFAMLSLIAIVECLHEFRLRVVRRPNMGRARPVGTRGPFGETQQGRAGVRLSRTQGEQRGDRAEVSLPEQAR